MICLFDSFATPLVSIQPVKLSQFPHSTFLVMTLLLSRWLFHVMCTQITNKQKLVVTGKQCATMWPQDVDHLIHLCGNFPRQICMLQQLHIALVSSFLPVESSCHSAMHSSLIHCDDSFFYYCFFKCFSSKKSYKQWSKADSDFAHSAAIIQTCTLADT